MRPLPPVHEGPQEDGWGLWPESEGDDAGSCWPGKKKEVSERVDRRRQTIDGGAVDSLGWMRRN